MNAAAKALASSNWAVKESMTFTMTRQRLSMLLLIIAVLISALAIVYVKTLNRRLFSDLQSQQQVRNDLYLDWGKLLLEQSTWATQARISSLAQQKLEMVVPEAKQVIMIKQ